jgi:predicted RNase H-like nuclease (RuvC/YqgF family)
MSFLGGIAAVVASPFLQHWVWRSEFEQQRQVLVLQKRTELLQKTVEAFARVATVQALKSSLDGATEVARTNVTCEREATNRKSMHGDCHARMPFSDEHIEALGRERYELNAQMMATLNLDVLYFGPLTQAAVKELVKSDIYSDDDARRMKVLDALGTEIKYGVPGGVF